jgi:hypothetical protein
VKYSGPGLDAVPLMDLWASSCERRQIDQRRAGWQLRSIGTWLEFHRVINADRASSCDPHGRGLDAQPWILGPEVCTTPDLWPAVCTTMDPRAGSLHNPGSNGRKYEVCRRLQTFGERLQTKPSSCDPLRAGWQFDLVINAGPVLDAVPSIDQRRPGQQYAIPCEPVGVPSSDQRRPGQQYAQPWIHGPA